MLNERKLLPLESVALAYIREACKDPQQEQAQLALQVLSLRLREQIPADEAVKSCYRILGTAVPAHRINTIIDIPREPICTRRCHFDPANMSARQKARTWTQYEDQRLLAGMRLFGCDNWPRIADFVGNGRNRSQCSQRWHRGLNPTIYKGPWTKKEEDELVSLVEKFGEKSWRQIASVFGNRSDVQCRYHYQQLVRVRKREALMNEKLDPEESSQSQSPEQKSVGTEDCVVVGDQNNYNFELLKQDPTDFIFDSLLDVDAWT